MPNKCIKGCYVKGCKIDYKTIFTGYVLNVDDEPIIDSIKRKVVKDNLLCELTNEGFDYNYVPLTTIPLSELTVGDYLLISSILPKLT